MPYNWKRERKVVRKHGRWKKKHAITAYFMAMPLLFETVAMSNAEINAMPHRVKFASDSFIIGIDNHASY
eukprot:14456968-Ditylum_brightwellii.AAC.1